MPLPRNVNGEEMIPQKTTVTPGEILVDEKELAQFDGLLNCAALKRVA